MHQAGAATRLTLADLTFSAPTDHRETEGMSRGFERQTCGGEWRTTDGTMLEFGRDEE